MQVEIVSCAAGRPVDEDAGGALGDVAVVVDGAGVPPRLRAGCRHEVAWFSHALAAALLRHGQDAPDLRTALREAIREVRSRHERTCDLEAGGPSATVAAVRRRGDELEHLVLCDAAILLRSSDGTVRLLTDDRLDRLRPGRPGPEIEALRNAEGGFWVARHEDRCADEALTGALPLGEVERIHLISDGVLRAVDPVGSHDLDALERDLDADAGAFLARLRADERGLPRERRPRKLHDDATAVTLRRF